MKPNRRRNLIAFGCGVGWTPMLIALDRVAPSVIGTCRPLLPLLSLAGGGLLVTLAVRQPRPFFSLGVALVCAVSACDVSPGDSVSLEVITGLLIASTAFGGEVVGTGANLLMGRVQCNSVSA